MAGLASLDVLSGELDAPDKYSPSCSPLTSTLRYRYLHRNPFLQTTTAYLGPSLTAFIINDALFLG